MSQHVLEVIACSVADAVEAERGGADRLEIVRDLHLGGLTPSWELVSEIKRTVGLPLRIMLRESAGYTITGEEEVKVLCDSAQRFSLLDVDGFVIGFLTDERVDMETTNRVLASAPNVNATFHHAFEATKDRLQALREIKELSRVDRLLSSGGEGELSERVRRLNSYDEVGFPKIRILAGGGIDGKAIDALMRTTNIREFHVGRAARSGNRSQGEVKAELVEQLVRLMK